MMGFRTGWHHWLVLCLVVLAPAAGPATALGQGASLAGDRAPEAATERNAHTPGFARTFMVAAANPLAAEAGREILRAGGSAVDAAIAVQMVLALVEPQSSGLGGGAFLLHYDAAGRRVTSFDGRETAPAAARPDRFLGAGGKPLPFHEAAVGGRAVGVPGVLRMLEDAHRRFGALPWNRLFERAAALAEDGFAVSPRLNGLLAKEEHLKRTPAAAALYYQPDGTPMPVGARLRNPELAATLRAVAERGADAFYTGPVAADIVRAVTAHPTNPGDLTEDDLRAYRARERPAVCGRYRAFTVCGMGPPSSGGVAVLQILGVLETLDMAALRDRPAEAAHWFAEAGRLAFADRGLYLADADFVPVPVKGLTDPAYIRGRAALLAPGRSLGTAAPGVPPHKETRAWGFAEAAENGTSHIAVVDAAGNAVSMTTSIEDQFGSRQMVRGFLLNNQLTDFAAVAEEGDKPVANRVEPGKRPRSSMAPTIVFDGEGRLHAVLGSPGGSAIINYVAKTLVGILDWQLHPQEAVDLPNAGSRNGPTELEQGTEAEGWAAALRDRGHVVRVTDMTSGIQAIVTAPQGYVGGADSRREGVAVGD